MVYEYAPGRKLIYTACVLGGLLGGVAATVGALTDWGPPPANPFIKVEHSAFWTDNGRWRVETDLELSEVCLVTVSRRFSADSGKQRPPVASYLGDERPGDLPYLLEVGPNTGAVWYEYEIADNMVGTTYLIESEAWRCENGWAGPAGEGRWIVVVGARP